MSTYYRCDRCEEIYEEDEIRLETVSGRVGGYESWTPDEIYSYCPHCDTDAENSTELDVVDLYEEIALLKEQLEEAKK